MRVSSQSCEQTTDLHMIDWAIERVVQFGPDDIIKDGYVHFGFHDANGRHYAIAHQKHFLGLIGPDSKLAWTLSSVPVIDETPNIAADLSYPIYIDRLLDDRLVVSNFGNARLYRVDPIKMEAEILVEGSALGMRDAGNCVVDNEGFIWLNEITGCRIWRFDPTGAPVLKIGDGRPGFQVEPADFAHVQFNWIYDLRKGPDGHIYVLDSKNFAVRMIDLKERQVRTIAGCGRPGYDGDGGDVRSATFGGDPAARYDGPISLSLDEEGNIFVGDRFNHVVRMICRNNSIISTIAGRRDCIPDRRNDPSEQDPRKLNLPQISSMDYYGGRLFAPTDIMNEIGDLAVLRKNPPPEQEQ